MIFSIFLSFALAQDLPGEILFEGQSSVVQEQAEPSKEGAEIEYKEKPTAVKKIKIRRSAMGNLPIYYLSLARESTESEVIQPKSDIKSRFDSLTPGKILEATIEHSIIAFPDETAPVVAQLTTKGYRTLKLIGESRLEKNSKRIFIDFKKLISGNITYEISAKAISFDSGPGLIGKYHSHEGKLFMGDFLSSFAAGYFEGTIPKKTNAQGEVVPDTSVDSALKNGMAKSSMATAERFREKLKSAPEFSELRGPIEIQVVVL